MYVRAKTNLSGPTTVIGIALDVSRTVLMDWSV